MRIGLISDTHMPGSLQELWPQAMVAFQDVDCILHAGDLHTIDIVDQLSELAPTYVSRGNGDTGLVDDRTLITSHSWQSSNLHITSACGSLLLQVNNTRIK